MSFKILIIDDDSLHLKTLQKVLEFHNYIVITSNDGRQGLEIAKNTLPDLIILDVMLPNIDGMHICRLLKFDEHYKHIPIILLTAKTNQSDRLIGSKVGANLYITKPYEIEEILKIVLDFSK